jgi:hypothetical protein
LAENTTHMTLRLDGELTDITASAVAEEATTPQGNSEGAEGESATSAEFGPALNVSYFAAVASALQVSATPRTDSTLEVFQPPLEAEFSEPVPLELGTRSSSPPTRLFESGRETGSSVVSTSAIDELMEDLIWLNPTVAYREL